MTAYPVSVIRAIRQRRGIDTAAWRIPKPIDFPTLPITTIIYITKWPCPSIGPPIYNKIIFGILPPMLARTRLVITVTVMVPIIIPYIQARQELRMVPLELDITLHIPMDIPIGPGQNHYIPPTRILPWGIKNSAGGCTPFTWDKPGSAMTLPAADTCRFL